MKKEPAIEIDQECYFWIIVLPKRINYKTDPKTDSKNNFKEKFIYFQGHRGKLIHKILY